MSIIKTSVAATLALVPALALASESLSLRADTFNGALHIIVINESDHGIKVRNDFLLDPLAGSLSLDFRRGGAVFPLVAQINPILPSEEAYVVLSPGEEIGQMLSYKYIKGLYSLKPGCYSIQATYRDSAAKDFAAYSATVKSNVAEMCAVKRGNSFELKAGKLGAPE